MGIPEGRIGEVGVIVEMFESKFGKRNYHQGQRVEGVWLVGAVERTPLRRMFAIIADERMRKTPPCHHTFCPVAFYSQIVGPLMTA